MNEKSLIQDFTEGAILPQLFRFGAPFIRSNLLQTVYNPVDMVVVGQVLGKSGWLSSLFRSIVSKAKDFLPAFRTVQRIVY